MRRLDLEHGRVELQHGAGGRATAELIAELFRAAYGNPTLDAGDDAAIFDLPPGRVVMSTDAYVVSPLEFPGGDIGRLAVHGTVNDVAMLGARPIWLSVAMILEEGLPLALLSRVVASIARAAQEAGVQIATGDTKVVERGKGDGIFLTTTGVGVVPPGRDACSGAHARPGDLILLSGTVGDHGAAILSCREGLAFDGPIRSDSRPLNGLVEAMFAAGPLHTLRDPTRGGLATALNELAHQSGVGLRLREADVPVDPAVRALAELLGLDPLYFANEGKLVATCAPADAPALLAAMRAHPHGQDAALIGVVGGQPGRVVLETRFGGERLLRWLAGDPLPRIC
jgi:hydrogenase expression/formation protein HypE